MERVIDGVRYKIQREPFELFDYEAIERHLEEMAAQGWILKSLSDYRWEYYKSEPQNLKYAVTYLPDAEDYMILNTSQQDLDEFCAKVGWKRVAAYKRAQIYCSELEDPVPIETDEWSRMESISKSRKTMLGGNLFIVIVWCFILVIQGMYKLDNPAELLSSYDSIITIFMPVLVILGWSIDIVYYFWWNKKSRESVGAGGQCWKLDGLYTIKDLMIPAIGIIISAALLMMEKDFITFLLYIMLIWAMLFGGKPYFRMIATKHWFISDKHKLRIIICYAIAFLCIIASAFVGIQRPEPVEDSRVAMEQSTFIASAEKGKMQSADAFYEVYEVKAEFLYPWLLEKWLKSETYNGHYEEMTTEEAEEWNADRGYKFFDDKGQLRYYWGLAEGNKFVLIRNYESELTAYKIQAMAEEIGF